MKDKQAPYAASHISKFIPGIAWFFLVLTLVCIPGFNLPKVDSWLIEINFDKLIHVGLFAVLAYLFMYPLAKLNLSPKERWHYIIKIAIATVIWGLTTEIIQKFFIPGRSFTLGDCISDGLGGFVALFCYKKRFPKTLRSS
ncbi:MAG: VanZ family protein [Ferruginibacter sp.]|nr:VanZ family protein [Chitinophagaceae bacterium]